MYDKLKNFTMVNADTFRINLELALGIKDVAGCVVECGVWRGGMIAGLCHILGAERTYYLCDSFEGLPPAREIDGPAALAYQADKKSPSYRANCATDSSAARSAMRLVDARKFDIVSGWFKDTLPYLALSESIALLRLDADWYDSTMVCLASLFDKLTRGGLIIVDDYYAWDGCSRALHDFLSSRKATERIRSRGDVCYLVKN